MRIKSFAAATVLLATSAPLWANSTTLQIRNNGDDGYFWHAVAREAAAQPFTKTSPQKPRMPSEREMMVMSTNELKRLHEEHLDYSVSTGRPEDVQNWQRIEAVMLKKAEAAAKAYIKRSSYLDPAVDAGFFDGFIWGGKLVDISEHKLLTKELRKPPMPSASELMAMDLEQLRQLVEEHLQYSVNSDDPEAVANLGHIAEVARDRIKAAENGQEDPITISNSTVVQGLQEAKDEFSLAVFTVPGCHACAAQKRALVQFNLRHGWQVREVNAQEHLQLAKKFNVYSAPTTLAIRHGTNQWRQLSVGITSLPSIEHKALSAVSLMRESI